MKKPIKIFYSELSGRFYATDRYEIDGNICIIKGKKYDVTNDIGAAIKKHRIEFRKVGSVVGGAAND